MKQAEKTLQTRRVLAASLKRHMKKKPLSKITVSEIISDCDVNRKTFYYHFQDIYDLFHWMLEEEAVEVVRHFDRVIDNAEAIAFVMDYIEQNDHMLNCAYDSVGLEGMKHFLAADFYQVMTDNITQQERELGVVLEDGFRQFLCRFYVEALSGILLEWMQDRTIRRREETIGYLLSISQVSIPAILRQFGTPVSGQAAEKEDSI